MEDQVGTDPRGWTWIALVIVVIGAFFLAKNLGDRTLGSDEAETALLAQSTLAHGYPTIGDDQVWLYPRTMHWTLDDGTWVWSPWLDEYITAASFQVLGSSSWSGRLPFVLVTLAAAVLLFLTAFRGFGWAEAGCISLALFLTNVAVLEHARQCRYYALTMLGAVLIVDGFVRLLRDEIWRGRGGLFLGLIVLFFSNILPTGVFLIALSVAAIRSRKQRPGLLADMLPSVAAAVAAGAVWLAYAKPSGQAMNFTLAGWVDRFVYYLWTLNLNVAPIIVIVAMIIRIAYLRLSTIQDPDSDTLDAIGILNRLLRTVVVCHLLILPTVQYEAFRYLLPAVPCVLLYLAWLLRAGIASRSFRWGLVCVLMLTDWLSLPWLSQGPRGPRLDDYVAEVSTPYANPVRQVAEYLVANANPTDKVLAADEELALAFHTGLAFSTCPRGEELKIGSVRELIEVSFAERQESVTVDDTMNPAPDWIISESIGRSFGGRTVLKLPESWQGRYQRIVLIVPDAPISGDDPDPATHAFFTDRRSRPVVLYRRLSHQSTQTSKMDVPREDDRTRE